ncbi:hypothetical protein MP638_005627 [Amoeboaphelidium occidentale]|nr:hypothetical protein MP638_005627 [Amoeboaphelidium occidentale]
MKTRLQKAEMEKEMEKKAVTDYESHDNHEEQLCPGEYPTASKGKGAQNDKEKQQIREQDAQQNRQGNVVWHALKLKLKRNLNDQGNFKKSTTKTRRAQRRKH